MYVGQNTVIVININQEKYGKLKLINFYMDIFII